eukprot:15460968-Alexandrium_andersonii.AAC.3
MRPLPRPLQNLQAHATVIRPVRACSAKSHAANKHHDACFVQLWNAAAPLAPGSGGSGCPTTARPRLRNERADGARARACSSATAPAAKR